MTHTTYRPEDYDNPQHDPAYCASHRDQRTPCRFGCELYQPDGRPIDGPRTTAATFAEQIAAAEGSTPNGEIARLDMLADWTAMYRNAAAEEGERWTEARIAANAFRRIAAATGRTWDEVFCIATGR